MGDFEKVEKLMREERWEEALEVAQMLYGIARRRHTKGRYQELIALINYHMGDEKLGESILLEFYQEGNEFHDVESYIIICKSLARGGHFSLAIDILKRLEKANGDWSTEIKSVHDKIEEERKRAGARAKEIGKELANEVNTNEKKSKKKKNKKKKGGGGENKEAPSTERAETERERAETALAETALAETALAETDRAETERAESEGIKEVVGSEISISPFEVAWKEDSEEGPFDGLLKSIGGKPITKSLHYANSFQHMNLRELIDLSEAHESLLRVESIFMNEKRVIMMSERVTTLQDFFTKKLIGKVSWDEWFAMIEDDFRVVFRDVVKGLIYLYKKGKPCGDLAFNIFVTSKGRGVVLPSLDPLASSRGDFSHLVSEMKRILLFPFYGSEGKLEEVLNVMKLPEELARLFKLMSKKWSLVPPRYLINHPFFWTIRERFDFFIIVKNVIRSQNLMPTLPHEFKRYNFQIQKNWSDKLSSELKSIWDGGDPKKKSRRRRVKEYKDQSDFPRFICSVDRHINDDEHKRNRNDMTDIKERKLEETLRGIFPTMFVDYFEYIAFKIEAKKLHVSCLEKLSNYLQGEDEFPRLSTSTSGQDNPASNMASGDSAYKVATVSETLGEECEGETFSGHAGKSVLQRDLKLQQSNSFPPSMVKDPIRLLIMSAAGKLGDKIIDRICSRCLLSRDQPIEVHTFASQAEFRKESLKFIALDYLLLEGAVRSVEAGGHVNFAFVTRTLTDLKSVGVALHKRSTDVSKKERLLSLPYHLKRLWNMAAWKLPKGDVIPLHMAENIVNNRDDQYIGHDELNQIAHNDMLDASHLSVYIRYLYQEKIQPLSKEKHWAFLCPHEISNVPSRGAGQESGQVEYIANAFKDVLSGVGAKKLFLAPYNTGQAHWTLAVIDPKQELLYYLNPVAHDLDEGSHLIRIIKSALDSFKKEKGKSNVTVLNIKCPRQTDGTSCAYFVMRFMRDIIGQKHGGIPQEYFPECVRFHPTLREETTYVQAQLDEIREEWAAHVQPHLDNLPSR